MHSRTPNKSHSHLNNICRSRFQCIEIMFRLLHQNLSTATAHTHFRCRSCIVSQHVVYNAQQKLKWMPAKLFVSSLSFLRLVSFDLSERHKIRLKSIFLIFLFALSSSFVRSLSLAPSLRRSNRRTACILSSFTISLFLSISLLSLHSYHSTHRFFFHSSCFVFVVVFVFTVVVVVVVDRS